jgi:hypothetical protein
MLAKYAGQDGAAFPLESLIRLQRQLNPALRALMAEVKGPVGNDARRLYLALWGDVEEGVLSVPDQKMREHWQPLLEDAKRHEAEEFLTALFRQPPAKTDKPGAFMFLQQVLKNRMVFEALLGEVETSEILTFLADPSWETKRPAQSGPLPLVGPGLPMSALQAPPRPMRGSVPRPMPGGGLPGLASGNRSQLAQNKAQQPDFGQLLAAARTLTSDPVANVVRQRTALGG